MWAIHQSALLGLLECRSIWHNVDNGPKNLGRPTCKTKLGCQVCGAPVRSPLNAELYENRQCRHRIPSRPAHAQISIDLPKHHSVSDTLAEPQHGMACARPAAHSGMFRTLMHLPARCTVYPIFLETAQSALGAVLSLDSGAFKSMELYNRARYRLHLYIFLRHARETSHDL